MFCINTASMHFIDPLKRAYKNSYINTAPMHLIAPEKRGYLHKISIASMHFIAIDKRDIHIKV